MKLLFFLAVWKRPEITEICFMGLNRLKKLAPIECFAVISEPEMIPLCEKYGVDWCMTQNFPLGLKKNYGVRQALKKDFDYLIELGSDDLLKNEILNVYKWDAPVLGLMDFSIIDTVNGRCKKISDKISKFGAGRAIRRDVLERGDLWASKNRALDNSSVNKLASMGIMQRGVKVDDPICVALKSDINLWSFNQVRGHKYPLEKALSGLSEEEVNAIECYRQKRTLADAIEG